MTMLQPRQGFLLSWVSSGTVNWPLGSAGVAEWFPRNYVFRKYRECRDIETVVCLPQSHLSPHKHEIRTCIVIPG